MNKEWHLFFVFFCTVIIQFVLRWQSAITEKVQGKSRNIFAFSSPHINWLSKQHTAPLYAVVTKKCHIFPKCMNGMKEYHQKKITRILFIRWTKGQQRQNSPEISNKSRKEWTKMKGYTSSNLYFLKKGKHFLHL